MRVTWGDLRFLPILCDPPSLDRQNFRSQIGCRVLQTKDVVGDDAVELHGFGVSVLCEPPESVYGLIGEDSRRTTDQSQQLVVIENQVLELLLH